VFTLRAPQQEILPCQLSSFQKEEERAGETEIGRQRDGGGGGFGALKFFEDPRGSIHKPIYKIFV
jgi:hypothetical protein